MKTTLRDWPCTRPYEVVDDEKKPQEERLHQHESFLPGFEDHLQEDAFGAIYLTPPAERALLVFAFGLGAFLGYAAIAWHF